MQGDMITHEQSSSIPNFIRQALTFGGGFLVASGWTDQQTMAQLIGAVATLLSLAWSIYEKRQLSKKLTKATTNGGRVS